MEHAIIKMEGQEYKGNLDFKALSLIQYRLKKDYDMDLKIGDIFTEVDKHNGLVMMEIVVQAILRVHTQLKREHIEDKISLKDYGHMHAFIIELMELSLPNE